MNSLSEIRGTQYINEPFNIRKESIKNNLAVSNWRDFFLSDKKHLFADYLLNISNNKIKDTSISFPGPLSENYKLITWRKIWKILFLPNIYDDLFDKILDCKKVYLFRHPIPTTLSRKYFPRLDSYANSSFSSRLNDLQLRVINKTISERDHFKMGVVDWALRNHILLNYNSAKKYFLFYEDIVNSPKREIKNLLQFLDEQKSFEKVYKRVLQPSGSTNQSTQKTISVISDLKGEERKHYLINRWKNKVDKKQIDFCQNVLDLFEIKSYNANESFPNK